MDRVDETFMNRAIELAARGEGLVSPNPLVGAVIVKSNRVIGEGFHRFDLLRHAESYALEMAGTDARGATLYCNLEPCSHQGRTPPCTVSVIESGIARVVVGMIDPDPRVNGRGVEQLKAAGIEVTLGVLESESVLLNEIYVKSVSSRSMFSHNIRFFGATVERWRPSPELLRVANRYDALALGQSQEVNASFVEAFLNREWHRDPVIVGREEIRGSLMGLASAAFLARVPIFAEAVASLNGAVAPSVQHQASGQSVSTKMPDLTSLIALPGSEEVCPTCADKQTLICSLEDRAEALRSFSSIFREDRSGEFVEITGYIEAPER